jgi:hypothetical protein
MTELKSSITSTLEASSKKTSGKDDSGAIEEFRPPDATVESEEQCKTVLSRT